MSAQEREYMKMARDPKFMAERWRQRLDQNEREYKARECNLSREDKKKYSGMLAKQKERVEHYKNKTLDNLKD